MPPFRAIAIALLMSVVWTTRPSPGQELDRVGEGRTALPSVVRVPMQGFAAPRLSGALDTGYGLTESQNGEGAHHRVFGTVGLGLAPMPGIELGLLTGIRHDMHPNGDSGTIGQPSLVARAGTRVAESLQLGADFGITFPGSEKVGDSLTSPAIDLRALFGWIPANGVRAAGFAGFRADQTSGVGDKAQSYRAGDRLALGLSDFNAVLVGAGTVVPLGRTELLGEVTGDLLVGSKAPPVSQSPLRADLGLRQALSERLWLELLTEYSLSSRPIITPSSPLIPVEPRFSITIGLRYRAYNGPQKQLARAEETPRPTPAPTPAPTPPPIEPTPPATSGVTVTVVDSAEHPLSDATVSIVTDSGERALDFKSGSTFAADSVPVGHARITVHAELMQDFTRDIEVAKDKPLDLRVQMEAAETSGQIRGLVRAFNGHGLSAHVHIEPGDRNTQADPDGVFSVDVSPGKYRVKVFIQGYQSQERVVEVGKNGVMVLNVDLQKGR